MANCRACGGVLGRDCFNEHDCLMISENNRNEPHVDYIEFLQARIKLLEMVLIDFGHELPYEVKPEDYINWNF